MATRRDKVNDDAGRYSGRARKMSVLVAACRQCWRDRQSRWISGRACPQALKQAKKAPIVLAVWTTARRLDSSRPFLDNRPSSLLGLRRRHMSQADLAKIIDEAFERREHIGPATKDPVREAVEAALDLLDRGAARVAEREANG